MNLPPNRVKTNRFYIVRHRRYPSKEWRVLAKDTNEAICVVLANEPRLAYHDLTAEEARG